VDRPPDENDPGRGEGGGGTSWWMRPSSDRKGESGSKEKKTTAAQTRSWAGRIRRKKGPRPKEGRGRGDVGPIEQERRPGGNDGGDGKAGEGKRQPSHQKVRRWRKSPMGDEGTIYEAERKANRRGPETWKQGKREASRNQKARGRGATPSQPKAREVGRRGRTGKEERRRGRRKARSEERGAKGKRKPERDVTGVLVRSPKSQWGVADEKEPEPA